MNDKELEQFASTRPGKAGFELGRQWAQESASLEQLGILTHYAEFAILHPEQIKGGASQGAVYWCSALDRMGQARRLTDLEFIRGFAAGALTARVESANQLRHRQAEEAKRKPFDEAVARYFQKSQAG
jgi:hypothetical protein